MDSGLTASRRPGMTVMRKRIPCPPSLLGQCRERLQLLALCERAYRRRVAVDPLLDDLAIPEAEFVDAAPFETRSVDQPCGLPLDNDNIAARGPVQQLPDKVGRGGFLQLHELRKLAALDRPVDQRCVQDAVRMPEIEKSIAVARRPGGRKPCHKMLQLIGGHSSSPSGDDGDVAALLKSVWR